MIGNENGAPLGAALGRGGFYLLAGDRMEKRASCAGSRAAK
jgi:hypothetical protein